MSGKGLDPADKAWIDEASYEDLLHKWRFTPLGDDYFQGARGDYFRDVMFAKKKALPPEEQVAISKRVGW